MLVYNENRYVPTDCNIMVIQDASENYFYIHRMLYDQAVILDDKYNGDYMALAAKLVAPNPVPDDRSDVDFFYEHAPRPINILAPFLLLCEGAFDNLDDMTGALHVMSNTFSFKRLPDVPPEVRLNSMTFSMSIVDEYSLAWNKFMMSCIPYSEDMFLGNNSAPTARSTHSSISTTSDEAEEEDENEDPIKYIDEDHVEMPLIDFTALLNKEYTPSEDLFDGGSDDNKEETPAPAPAPTSAPASAPSGMDFLKSLT